KFIQKLASYLPKDELWPYIETGFLRSQNKFNALVSDSAYKHWEIFATHRELTKIRTNPLYYKNLSVLSNWNGLFSEPTKPIATLQQATERLTKFSTKINYQDRSRVRELRTSIALSTNIEQLKNLAYHENIHIALASYYALSKTIPDEVAYEILSQAIYKTEKLEYSYWVGGDVSIGGNGLTLGQAAYDLFSDYLSVKQISEIVHNDPLLKSNTGKKSFKLRSQQLVNRLKHRNIYTNRYKQMIDTWHLKQELNRKEVSEIKNLITKNYLIEQLVTQPTMTKNLSLAIIELSGQGEIRNNYEWIYVAFKIHNDYSKNLVEYFLSEKNQKIDIKPIIEILLYQHNWPRNWQDLKQKVNDLAIEYDVSIL
ncbi:MAG: hypothetical protein L3J83_09450, partial [Proteobacteria bacterium]|nr:hypothetical protein [Pseudomonadota bacterium]